METAAAALDPSCLAGPELPAAQNQIQDPSKDYSNPKQCNRWKGKIRTALPLIFIKHFQKNLPPDDEDLQTVPQAESSFEEIVAAAETNVAENSKTSEGPSKRSRGADASSPRKRLMLAVSDREKLLSWDEAEESSNVLVDAETRADKSQADSGQDGGASGSQSSASAPSAFQLLANAFRRTFNVTNPPGGSDSAVIMRTKRSSQPRPRPLSEGTPRCPQPPTDKRITPRWPAAGADVWGGGRDLPSLLQEVSLQGSGRPGRESSEDARQMSRRSVNLFMSLRLKKQGASDGGGQGPQTQEGIRTVLTNVGNKPSCEASSGEPSSGEDENDNTASSWKLCLERKGRRQEKMVARQARRDQLKRLHRAQAVQRQLEEVAEKQRDLEERGVAVEKSIRREAGADSSPVEGVEEAKLYQTWFELVLEKNRLARYESELMIFAQELELEDTQSRLQQDLRQRMAIEDTKKSASELQEEQQILSEIMRTVEKRDALVSILEEQRLKERAEDRDLESLALSKGYDFHWAQKDDG